MWYPDLFLRTVKLINPLKRKSWKLLHNGRTAVIQEVLWHLVLAETYLSPPATIQVHLSLMDSAPLTKRLDARRSMLKNHQPIRMTSGAKFCASIRNQTALTLF